MSDGPREEAAVSSMYPIASRDESDGASVKRASIAELRAGHPLLVFREGTGTRRAPIDAFKGGFAPIAKKARAPSESS